LHHRNIVVDLLLHQPLALLIELRLLSFACRPRPGPPSEERDANHEWNQTQRQEIPERQPIEAEDRVGQSAEKKYHTQNDPYQPSHPIHQPVAQCSEWEQITTPYKKSAAEARHLRSVASAGPLPLFLVLNVMIPE
jgi:hypothetical protein